MLFAGCGGSGDSSEQIDKEAFIAQANKICEEVSGKLAADITSINKKASANPNADLSKAQIAMVKEGLIPRLEEELRRIRALGVPQDAKREVEALFAAYRKGIERTKEKAKLVALTERLAPHEVIAVAGTRFGVTECPISPVNASN
jgi:hypothetical protein